MNENKIKNFAKLLVELSKGLALSSSMSATSRFMSFAAGDQMIGLSAGDVGLFDDLANKFYKECGWEDKYSEHYTRGLLCKVLGELFVSNQISVAEAALSKQVADYQTYQSKHTVLLPLCDLELGFPTFKIGRVNIIRLQKAELAKRLGDHLMSFPAQQLLETHSDRVLAEVEVIAEPTRAMEIAVEETRRVLEVLRYGITPLTN